MKKNRIMRMEELIEEQDDMVFVRIDKLSNKKEGKNVCISVRDLISSMHPLNNTRNKENIEEIKQKLQEELDNLELDEYDLDPYLRTPQKINLSSINHLENQFIKEISRLFDSQRQFLAARNRIMLISKIIYSINKPEIEDDIEDVMDIENNGIKQDIERNDRLHTDEGERE